MRACCQALSPISRTVPNWIMAIAGALLLVASLLAIAAAGVAEAFRTVTTEDLRRALLAALSHGAARQEGPTQPQPLASPGWR